MASIALAETDKYEVLEKIGKYSTLFILKHLDANVTQEPAPSALFERSNASQMVL